MARISKLKEKFYRGLAVLRKLSIAAPVMALLAWPQGVFAGTLGTAAKAGLSMIGSLATGLIGTGAEMAASVGGWLFIIWAVTATISAMFGKIFLFLVNFLIGISQYNSFLGSQIVQIGWPVARDLANLFLVVALLVIAFATILNIQSYQAQALLKDFLITALFVNFSRMICGLIIDAAQVVMMTFVAGFSDTAGGNFVELFKTTDWFKLAISQAGGAVSGAAGAAGSAAGDTAKGVAEWISNQASNMLSGFAGNIFAAFIALLACVAILSLLIILIQRIVVLWFLIVASPLAFVARVLPATKSFYSKWWSEFSKQLIVGPVVAFIVWISLASVAASPKDAFNVLNDSMQKDKLFAESQNAGGIGNASQGAIAMNAISQWENLAMFMLPVFIFILGAKWATGLAGGLGASVAGKMSALSTGLFKKGARKMVMGGLVGQTWSAAQGKGSTPGRFISGTLSKGVGGGLQGLGKMTGIGALSTAGGKVKSAAGWIGGAKSRAVARKNFQGAAIGASKLGLGELGKKRQTAEDQAAVGERYAIDGRKAWANSQEKIQNLRNEGRHDEANDLEKEAVARLKASEGKAAEERKKGMDAQKDVFKAEGKTDPQLLAREIEKKRADGTLDEVQVMAANDMMKESFEKEISKEVDSEREKFLAEHPGATFTAEQERAAKDKVILRQKEVKDRMKNTVDKFHEETGAKQVADQRKAVETSMSEDMPESKVNQANKDFQSGTINEDGLAQAIGREVAKATSRDYTDNKKDAFILSAVKNLRPADQPGFLTSLNNQPGVGIQAAVQRVVTQVGNLRLQTTQVRRAIEESHANSSESGKENGWSIKDLGANTDRDGKMSFQPEQTIKIQALFQSEPRVIANIRADAMGNSDLKRIIGQSLNDVGLRALNDELRNSGGDIKGIAAQMRKINDAMQAHSSDRAAKAVSAQLANGWQARVQAAAAGGGAAPVPPIP